MDLELRVQEIQLENELRRLHDNPQAVTDFNDATLGVGIVGDYHSTANPTHIAQNEAPLNLGLSTAQAAVDALPAHIPPPPPPVPMIQSTPLKKDGTPDLRYKRDPQ